MARQSPTPTPTSTRLQHDASSALRTAADGEVRASNVPLAMTALVLAALSAGFAAAINVVHYRSWPNVGQVDFAAFQSSSARHTVPAAVAVGLPSMVWAIRLARRGLRGVDRRQLLAAAALSVLPWLATPIYFVPLQQRLHDAGPTSGLVRELVWADLVLRVVPPMIQTLLLAMALRRHRRSTMGNGGGEG